MNTPHGVQLSRAAGWRMPPNTISVARPTLWGNPHYVSKWRDAKTCVALFEDTVRGVWDPKKTDHLPPAWQQGSYREREDWLARWRKRAGALPIERIEELRGKNLACWCRIGDPCHRDVLLRLANR